MFLVFSGIFWSMVLDWWIIRAGFVVGVAISVLATIVYVRAASARRPGRARASLIANAQAQLDVRGTAL